MNLNTEFQSVTSLLAKSAVPQNTYAPSSLISMLDLTLLKDDATSDEIQQLSEKANQYAVAAICIFIKYYSFIPTKLMNYKKATVINFPFGNDEESIILKTIDEAVERYHINEIDFVFPYASYLSGDTKSAFQTHKNIYQHCKDYGLTLKVILETGIFPSLDVIYHLCQQILDIGCDFIKTSTGKTSTGATLPAAFAILKAIKNSSCGIKISGGIKTQAIALEYLQLAEFILEKPMDKHRFRIGASQLFEELIASMKQR